MTHRAFVDSDQVTWTVWEIRWRESSTSVRVRTELAGGWLAFQCAHERRRFAPAPDGWETLSDYELESLCQRAESAPFPAGRAVPPERAGE